MFKRKDDGTYAFSMRFWAYAIVATFFIIWIGWNTQQARNETERLARDTTEYAQATNDCLTQLINVLIERSKITEENDDLSQEQRKAIFDLIGEAVNPPPELRGLTQADPRYTDWTTSITVKYYNILAKSQARQDALVVDRDKHPIPNPNCGELTKAKVPK